MEREIKRTITEVQNVESGEQIIANEFFKKPLDELTICRSELQKAINGYRNPLFKCFYCKQLIRIRGGKSELNKSKAEIFHFAHLKDSDDCHIKTNNKYTKEEVDRIKYNGAKESILHQNIKENIADCLKRNQTNNKGISQIKVERVILDKVDKEWKKPDINAYFHSKRIAIELQLSTTWLDVITKRQQFYKEHGIYILWIFHSFNLDDDVRKLTFNDVIYTNNQNAYIFDEEMYEKSALENDLILKCYYKTYYSIGNELNEDWDHSFIRLSDLTFDPKNFRIFYHDSARQKREVEKEIQTKKTNEEIAHKYHVLRMNRENELKEKKDKDRKAKKNRIENIINDLTSEIDGIKTLQEEYSGKIIRTKSTLDKKSEFIRNINDYLDKTIKHLADSRYNFKPFFDNDDLLKALKEEYGEELSSATETIFQKELEQTPLSKKLRVMKSIPLITISDQTFSNVDKSKNWDYLKENYTKIKIIDKKLIGDLFAESGLRSIRSDLEILQFQYSTNYLFLMDFGLDIIEINKQIEKINEIIDEKGKVIATISQAVKTRLETHMNAEIQELENKIETYEKIQNRNDSELELKEIELANNRTALFKINIEDVFS